MSFLVWFVSLRRRNDKLVTLGSVANIEKTAFYNCFFFVKKTWDYVKRQKGLFVKRKSKHNIGSVEKLLIKRRMDKKVH